MRASHSNRGIKSRRGGWQLVELLMVITITSLLMLVSGRMMRSLLSTETSVGESLSREQQWSRLGEQFRSDAHRARAVTSGDQQLKLTLDDETVVVYRIHNDELSRERGEDEKAHKVESYRADDGGWKIESDPDARLVRIVRSAPLAQTYASNVGSGRPRSDQVLEAATGLFAGTAP
jgi:hypothetical protein